MENHHKNDRRGLLLLKCTPSLTIVGNRKTYQKKSIQKYPRQTNRTFDRKANKQKNNTKIKNTDWNNLTDRQFLQKLALQEMGKTDLLTNFTEDEISYMKTKLQNQNINHDNYKDLRHLPWVSIDNDDTMDIDQITAAQMLDDGRVRVWISVIECDVLIEKNDILDAHALHNTASVYLPAGVFTMLPLDLSYDITSFVEGKDRPSFVFEMTFENADSGIIVEESVYLALVNNKAKLAYNSMSDWLNNKKDMPTGLKNALTKQDNAGLDETLKLQDKVAIALLRERYKHGALEFEKNDPHIEWEGDSVHDLVKEVQNRAQKLIENLMVAANGISSRFLKKNNFPSLQRIVKKPEKWDKIVELAKGFGYPLPDEPDSIALRRFLATRREADPTLFQDLSLTVIKLMGRGEYIFSNPNEEGGHFGLSVIDYTHSTAPNRRYPDLITQRLLRALLNNKASPYSNEELEEIAQRASDQAQVINKIERQLMKSAGAILLKDRVGEVFEAVIVGCNPKKDSTKDVYIRLLDIPIEGKLIEYTQTPSVGTFLNVILSNVRTKPGFIDFIETDLEVGQ